MPIDCLSSFLCHVSYEFSIEKIRRLCCWKFRKCQNEYSVVFDTLFLPNAVERRLLLLPEAEALALAEALDCEPPPLVFTWDSACAEAYKANSMIYRNYD